jgi:hypothetical protein
VRGSVPDVLQRSTSIVHKRLVDRVHHIQAFTHLQYTEAGKRILDQAFNWVSSIMVPKHKDGWGTCAQPWRAQTPYTILHVLNPATALQFMTRSETMQPTCLCEDGVLAIQAVQIFACKISGEGETL